jgi:exosortase B
VQRSEGRDWAAIGREFVMDADWRVRGMLGFGLLLLYVPTTWRILATTWLGDSEGHIPIVAALALWLILCRWNRDHAGPSGVDVPFGWALVGVALCLYVVGQSQEIAFLEVGSCIPLATGLILLFAGRAQLRRVWFGLFFLMFAIPMPGPVIDALTQPMKIAVSYVVESGLHAAGFPVARAGVMLQVGPYQLMVADACAGMQTLFTLEAIGLFYLNVVKSTSFARNVVLGAMIVPISFTANVLRVAALCLITLYLGDEAGQSFLHEFAGLVLFLTALGCILAVDVLLRRWIPEGHHDGR